MGYYYTVKEYASKKGMDLSLQDEATAVASATVLSNERGVPINKIYCGTTNSSTHCYAARILQEALRPLSKNAAIPKTKRRQQSMSPEKSALTCC